MTKIGSVVVGVVLPRVAAVASVANLASGKFKFKVILRVY